MNILEAIKVLEGLRTVEYISDKQDEAISKAITIMKLYVSLSKAEFRNAVDKERETIDKYSKELGVNFKEL